IQTAQNTSLAGGSFNIKRVLAYRDVHLLAPAKTITAREWFDADFIQIAPAPSTDAEVLSSPPAAARDLSVNSEDLSGEISSNSPSKREQNPLKDEAVEKPDELPILGSAERVWVKIETAPKPSSPNSANDKTSQTKVASTSESKTGSRDLNLGTS